MKNKSCESCLMPLRKDPGIPESDKYCSFCFKNGKFCYEGNDLRTFQKEAYKNQRNRGINVFKAQLFTWIVKFAPRWKDKEDKLKV